MKKFLLFCSMFFVFSFKVYASHLDLYKIEGVYSSQYNMDNGSYFSSNQKKYVMDGRVVYCIEPGINIMTREYESLDLSRSNFSQDVLDAISLIGYYGYDYPGHSTDRYFMATQELIWEVIGNNEVHFTTGINNTGDYIDIDYEKNEIMSLVNSHYMKPSFDSGSFDVVVGDDLVLIDDNHILSSYEVLSDNAYIDGDKLIIKNVLLGSNEIKLKRKKFDNLDSVYYMAYNSQDFMFLRVNDLYSSIDINGFVPYSNVSLYKTGEVLVDYDGDFIYDERGLDGITFGLYSLDDIYVNDELVYMKDDLVDELVTSNGYALSRNIPNGKYYLKELDTYSDLILGDDVNIEVSNNSSLVYTYELNLKNERKNTFVSINKKGEVFDNLNSSHFEGLSGVKVGLYSHDDIYSYDDKLLIGKDNLINTFVTDSSGNVLVDMDLPISTYYFKELETPDSYILDDSIYDVDMKNSVDSISYGSGDIVNYLKKGKLNINKLDIYGNRLDGASFSLYRGDDLIYEGSTFSGNICVDNLPYGQYKLFEVSAPNGYIKSDLVYDILIDSSLVNIDVYNEKLPITSDIYFVRKMFSSLSILFGLLGVLYVKRIKDN